MEWTFHMGLRLQNQFQHKNDDIIVKYVFLCDVLIRRNLFLNAERRKVRRPNICVSETSNIIYGKLRHRTQERFS